MRLMPRRLQPPKVARAARARQPTLSPWHQVPTQPAERPCPASRVQECSQSDQITLWGVSVAAVVQDNTRIVVWGGYGAKKMVAPDVFVLDPRASHWTVRERAPLRCCHWCASIPAQHCVPAQKMTSSGTPSARHGASLAVATVSVPTQDGQGMTTCQLAVCELTAHVRRAGTTTAAQLILTGGWTGTVRDGAVAAATLQPWPTKQKPPSLDSVSRPCLGLLLEE